MDIYFFPPMSHFIIGNIKLCAELQTHLTLLPAIKNTDCILHVSVLHRDP